MLDNANGCTVIYGQAKFISPHEVQVADQTLRADQIFINVGGRAAIPDLPGLNEIPYLTNSTLLQLTELPRHLIVIGGGAVGVEFAQIFRRLGSEVTLIEMKSALVHREDAAASKPIERTPRAGRDSPSPQFRMRLLLSNCPMASRVHVELQADEPEVHGSHVLLAMGRTPNTGDLGLDTAGVHTDPQGYIPVDDQLRTNVPHIWALGDCNGAAPSPTPPTTISRSSPPTCSTALLAASPTESPFAPPTATRLSRKSA